MRTRKHELALTAAGMLLLSLVLGLLFSGCEEESGSLQPATQQLETSIQGTSTEPPILRIICFLFPMLPFCHSYYNSLESTLHYPGEDGWRPTAREVVQYGPWHNACLDSWVELEFDPVRCYDSFLHLAQDYDIRLPRNAEYHEQIRACFAMLGEGTVSVDQIPSPQQLLQWWRMRPSEAPLARNAKADALIAGLADGISPTEIKEWRGLPNTVAADDTLGKWMANTMLASVEWWTSRESNVDWIPWGVSADLSALTATTNPTVIGIASAAGVIADLLSFFRDRN